MNIINAGRDTDFNVNNNNNLKVQHVMAEKTNPLVVVLTPM